MPSEPSRNAGTPPDRGLEDRQQAVAQYISDMILELRNMAKSVKLAKVMVPLEFAYYEAFAAANVVAIPPGEAERLERLSRMSMQAGEPDKNSR